jgi:hypothetical protein
MKRMSAFLWTTAVASLAVASQARADFMNWSYSTVSSPPVITSGTGSVQLTGVTNGTAGSSIPLLGIQDSSAATTTAPDVFKSNFNVALKVTDNQTHDSGTLSLAGTLTGSLNANGSNLVASFAGPSSLTLDGHQYTVSVPSLQVASPNTPQQTLVASLHVSGATTGGGTTPPPGPPPVVVPPPVPAVSTPPAASTPEPTGLVLGSLGLSLLGMARGWQRLRRSAALVG